MSIDVRLKDLFQDFSLEFYPQLPPFVFVSFPIHNICLVFFETRAPCVQSNINALVREQVVGETWTHLSKGPLSSDIRAVGHTLCHPCGNHTAVSADRT